MISLTHPQRQSRQYANSERDVAYLEKQGWVREKPLDVPAQWDEASTPTRPFKNELVSVEITRKPGRPRKS
jgi:hypothetical protein